MNIQNGNLREFAPVPEGQDQYTPEFIGAWDAIKLREDDKSATIGITKKTPPGALNRLCNFHRKDINFIRLETGELSAWLSGKMGEASARDGRERGEARNNSRLSLDKLANDAPVINLVNSVCIGGIRSGASDIHLESGRDAALVRYRIDGALRTIRTIEAGRFPAVSTRVKVMANLNILERRRPQDGRITVTIEDDPVDLRVSVVPTTEGESIVLRILGRKAAASSLGELGFGDEQTVSLRRLLSLPHGLILVTGPTGSGKTTTLNTMLSEIVSETVKIITIEDPVEFTVPGVNQIQINEQIGLGFDTLLKRVLRQDPNVILIGEIRDSATAEIALRSALTGHLVLSTLHTNDSASVIPRLVNMGVEPYLIASVLKGAAAQRLVRKICPRCKEAYKADAEERRVLEHAGFGTDMLYRGKGCGRCDHTGFSGRTLITELFTTDPALEELIMRRENISALTAHLKGHGMRTLPRDGLEKAAAGITTLGEVEHEVIID
ncbi:MAG: GspE/PulE family protein [Spirochaetaceae bacterium]|jgi:type II secretory ATPase GspE/PulE/Tfp pilus assembly ATPase PilB-like protein|nr:GspE/PulE family protein [Spirochaetaceae bacterium]